MIIINVFDPKDFEIYTYGNPYTGGNVTPFGVTTWASKAKADWVFNLAFFDFANAYNNAHGIGGRTLQKVYNPHLGDIGCPDAVKRTDYIILQGSVWAGWATAVLNGIVQTRNLNATAKRARNMNGITADGRYIHVTTNYQTELYVANYVNTRIQKDYGTKIRYLFVEDSGGSTQEYSAISRLGYYPEGQRAVASVMCIRRKTIYTFNRTISNGCRGEDCRILQQALGGIEVDGIFGRDSTNRLKQAQKALRLAADGYFGPLSARAMGFNFK